MPANARAARRGRRDRPADGESSRGTRASCYLTRGSRENEWYVWNIAPGAVRLGARELFWAHVVSADFDSTRSLLARALSGLTVRGSGYAICVLGRDMRLETESAGRIAELRSAATQLDLEDMCASKGVDCAVFLEHHTRNPQDEEMQLGARVCSLYALAVAEMLARKYDIMHHYPLFNGALGMHYSEGVSSEPPTTKDMMAAGGLLDRSAAAHRSLHGIPLEGLDHTSFSKWNHPYRREDTARLGGDVGRGREEEGERDKRDDDSDRGKEEEDREPGSPRTPQAHVRDNEPGDTEGKRAPPREQKPGASDAERPASPRSEDGTRATFNNLPGVLTDGPRAFPYAFSVRTGNDLTFGQLVDYCLARTREPVGTLPSRDRWGSVNPVLLMEDPVDPDTGARTHLYTVTSRGHLSTIAASRSLCYNEVFLPGRPVSRLNLDVDLKCCRGCNGTFSVRAEGATRRKVSKALAGALSLVIVESLLRRAKVTRSELESEPRLRELAEAVGKIAVYFRACPAKPKLSLRMLWYLPEELCSYEGIDAYGPLLEEMEKVSLRYHLVSYPSDADSCELCVMGREPRRPGLGSSGASRLSVRSARTSDRRSAIDKAPYSSRKCVRLPNCYKDGYGFEYVDTFNTRGLEDPGLDDPLSLSVGLSSNPVLSDVTSLGARFLDVLKASERSRPHVAFTLCEVPDDARVDSEARRLAALWRVPVSVRRTGRGLFCVQAKELSPHYPCPIHNRVHSTSRLGALVFATHTRPHCFVP